MKILEDYVLFDRFDTLSDEFFGECIHVIDEYGIYQAPSPNIAYHYIKAYIFRDDEVCDVIKDCLRSNIKTPMEINEYIIRISRIIKEYNDDIWNSMKYDIMWRILLDKFKNKKYREELLSFPGKHFIYCGSGEWTCGYDIEDAMNHQHSWSSNILGNMMTKMRDDLDCGRVSVTGNTYIDICKYIRVEETNQLNLTF